MHQNHPCSHKSLATRYLQVWHTADQAAPEAKQVVHAAGGPLPTVQTVDSEVSNLLDPVDVVVNSNKLRQLR
eukprot:351893-Chlamydomonas_euryale.AAC.20